MAITITVPAPDFNLTTLTRVKDRLKIKHNSRDQQLSVMITGVSKSLTRKLRREFAKETIVETVKGYGTTQLLLTRSPIISVSSILLDGVTPIIDFSIEDYESSILYRRSGWDWTVVSGFMGVGYNPVPNSEESLFSVTYDAGYILPGWESQTRDLPEDVEDLALDYLHFLYANRSQKDVSIRSYTIGDISIGKSTQTAIVDFLADFNRRCLDYLRIV